jgi:acetyl-CoA carboxylase biotin carboxyl carrier protein
LELKDIKELIRFIDKSEIKEFEIETEEGERIYISKKDDAPIVTSAPAYAMAPASVAPAAVPAAEVAPASLGSSTALEIKTPIVGTFYEAPSPGAEPFVKEGDTVRRGQTLCIIEAMKIMNEIEAEMDCRIVRKLGENAKPVEYGESIFVVEPV